MHYQLNESVRVKHWLSDDFTTDTLAKVTGIERLNGKAAYRIMAGGKSLLAHESDLLPDHSMYLFEDLIPQKSTLF